MEIFLDKRAVKQIRQSATDAVDDGDTETLREDVMDAFSEEQIEEVERRLDNGDIYDFISDAIEEWDGDDVDELFELLETHLSDIGIELKYKSPELEDEEEEAAEDEEEEFSADDEEEDSLTEDEPLDLPDSDTE
jgi:transcriptional regulator